MLKRGRKIILGISLCIGLATFSGCSNIEDYTKDKITERMIQDLEVNDTDYKEYEENPTIVEDVNLKEEEVETVTEPIVPTAPIHVTFANNPFLKISYYSDAELINLIDTDNCYLSPEDSIYASIINSNSVYSNMYTFSEYRVYEYDENGEKIKVNWADNTETMVCQIPKEYKGTELSIIPVGEYKNRSLSFQDYILNEKGKKVELSGKWIINNEAFYEEEKEISSIVSYEVRYEYDKDKYYYISSEPQCYFPKDSGNTDGEVIFKKANADEQVESYSVQLQPYITVYVDNEVNGVKEIFVDGEKQDIDVTEKKLPIEKLKCGAVVKIVTKQKHKVSSTDVSVLEATEQFTFTIPETKEQKLYVDVNKWNEKNIKIEIDKVTVKEKLEGLLAKLSDKGEKESILTLRTGDKTYSYEDLQNGAKVVLNEKENLIISVNENLLEECKVQLIINDKKNINIDDSSKVLRYVFSYQEVSKVRFVIKDNVDESIVWKAKLKVVLEELDHNITFYVTQDKNVLVNNKGYTNTGKKKEEILYDGDFNAEKDVVISASGIQYYTNKALRLEIIKDGKCEDIRYVTTASLKEAISAIQGDSFCNEIVVKISMVDVVKYREHTQEGAFIQVKLMDGDKHILKDGEVLEDFRKVSVKVIIKNNNYYIKGVEGTESPSKEMKFSKLDVEKIVKEYPVKKLIRVTLDTADPYGVGKVTYIVNKKEEITMTSIRFLREEDKLQVRYEVKEPDYKIKGIDIVTAIAPGGDSEKRKTWEIPVSTELDRTRKTVTKEDIQVIPVEKKGK